jgi:hypothetical protein
MVAAVPAAMSAAAMSTTAAVPATPAVPGEGRSERAQCNRQGQSQRLRDDAFEPSHR